MVRESKFEATVCKKIKSWDSKIRVHKNDPNSTSQGQPDRIVLFDGKFAMLEFKASRNAIKQPNQEWWINYYNNGNGFAKFIYPENSEEVLNDLKNYFDL